MIAMMKIPLFGLAWTFTRVIYSRLASPSRFVLESLVMLVRDVELPLRIGFHHSCIEQLFIAGCLAPLSLSMMSLLSLLVMSSRLASELTLPLLLP